MNTRRFPALCLLSLAALVLCSTVSAQPLGYERWTDSNADTDVFFDRTFAWVSSTLDNPLLLGMPAPPKKNTRLIDIELNINPQGNDLRVSGIWVENKDNFAQESWFAPILTQKDVEMIQEIDDLVIVDIERYRKQGQSVFAAVVQRNRYHQEWVFLPTVTLPVIQAWRNDGYRAIDIDYLYGEDSGSEVANVFFDAIMVRNAGPGYIKSDIRVSTQADVWDLALEGRQVTDIEYIPEWNQYISSWVQAATLWDLIVDQNAADIWNFDVGKVVDLEGSHNGPKKWYKIHKY